MGQHRGTRRKRQDPPSAGRAPAFTAVAHRQLALFPAARDLAHALAHGFPPAAEPRMVAFLDQFLIEHARKHGWSLTHTKRTRRGLAIALGLQDTLGAPLRATDIIGLQGIGITTLRLLEVCAAAGLLDDDRELAVDKWFKTAVAELPEQMRHELERWYTIMLKGSSTPPRSKPRSETTTRLYLRWSLPALHVWAASGQTSLREITPEDVGTSFPFPVIPALLWGKDYAARYPRRAPPSDQRTIPLAQPVRDRLSSWLAYREQCWPSTRNPHVFISRRTALDSAPVGAHWITTSMGMTVQQAREDRILHELHASGGDLRRICDMFGLSIAGASRYAAVLAHPGLRTG